MPFISFFTPARMNKLCLHLLDHSLISHLHELSIQMMMSDELLKPALSDDPYKLYLASSSLSRFQCESLLLRSPSGSFLFRNPHKYSEFVVLSYHLNNRVYHELFRITSTGYASQQTEFSSFLGILNTHTELVYGVRLNEGNQVVAIDTMPWFTNERVKDVRGKKSS